MNYKHLFWIIPFVLILGGIIGFKIFEATTNTLSDMTKIIDKCSIQTLSYTANHNPDCAILIQGYMKQCSNINRTIEAS